MPSLKIVFPLATGWKKKINARKAQNLPELEGRAGVVLIEVQTPLPSRSAPAPGRANNGSTGRPEALARPRRRL